MRQEQSSLIWMNIKIVEKRKHIRAPHMKISLYPCKGKIYPIYRRICESIEHSLVIFPTGWRETISNGFIDRRFAAIIKWLLSYVLMKYSVSNYNFIFSFFVKCISPMELSVNNMYRVYGQSLVKTLTEYLLIFEILVVGWKNMACLGFL